MTLSGLALKDLDCFQEVSFDPRAKDTRGEPNGGPKGKHWQVRDDFI